MYADHKESWEANDSPSITIAALNEKFRHGHCSVSLTVDARGRRRLSTDGCGNVGNGTIHARVCRLQELQSGGRRETVRGLVEGPRNHGRVAGTRTTPDRARTRTGRVVRELQHRGCGHHAVIFLRSFGLKPNYFFAVFFFRLFTQSGLMTWRERPRASAKSGTSSVITLPAPM
jgi:hypothetical protein